MRCPSLSGFIGAVAAFDPDGELPLREISFRFVRSAGPGGQNVNKVASKAVLRWNIGESRALPDAVRERLVAMAPGRITAGGDLVLSSQRFRDRGRNVADCLEKLRALLRAASAERRARTKTTPGRAARARRVDAKRRRSRAKELRRRPPSDDG